MNDIHNQIRLVKDAAASLLQISDYQRSAVLQDLAKQIIDHQDLILEENAGDLSQISKDHPFYDRLLLTDSRIDDMAQYAKQISALPSPVGRILLEKTLPNRLKLQKVSVPFGVVGVIYESRPNVTLDVFSLCFKSGNGCILKGGKEAHRTNLVLFNLIQKTLESHNLPLNCAYLLPANRQATTDLLNARGLVDICIPRGSQALIDFVRDHAKIPVIETGAGIVHTFFDLSGDLEKGTEIIKNAKTRRTSVCNALDTLLVHQGRLNDLPYLVKPLLLKEVEIYADTPSYNILSSFYPQHLLHRATEEDFGREFLSLKISIKTVDSCQEAVCHIQKYTSAHSEAIISQDPTQIQYFLNTVDAAALYVNASTAFTDGGEFGMGAEIGISTQKLHARGPMGLEELTSYKWLIYGDGQIRA